jgi:hypothetical protein
MALVSRTQAQTSSFISGVGQKNPGSNFKEFLLRGSTASRLKLEALFLVWVKRIQAQTSISSSGVGHKNPESILKRYL